MFNPNDSKHMTRLTAALEHSWSKLEVFRRRNREAVEQYVGSYYSEDGAQKEVLITMIETLVKTYTSLLIGRPPRVLVVTRDHRYKSVGNLLQEAVNFDVASTRISADLERAVRSSLFTMGIVKVGMAEAGSYELDGTQLMRHRPYIRNILPEDWVQDMTARSVTDWKYAGHRYRVCLDAALEDKSYTKEGREALRRASKDEDKPQKNQSTRMIEVDQAEGDYEETTPVWDIYLRGPRLLVTLAGDRSTVLRVMEWTEAPERGPFHQLFYDEVEGNPFPLSPVVKILQLHNLVNVLARKIARQAKDSKLVGAAMGEDLRDAEKLRKTPDGSIAGVENPQAIKMVKLGGIDQQVAGMMMQFRQMLSMQAGNLDILSGGAAQSETLGQDQLLAASSNQRVSSMQDRGMLFYKGVLEDYSWWKWRDPIESYQVTVKIPGVGEYPTELTPEMRSHDLFQHQMEIEPYSMEYSTPEQRKQKIMGFVMQGLLPAQQLLAQQDLQIDFRALVEMCAKYGNSPELRDIIIRGGQSLAAGDAPTENPPFKPPTHSKYERISSSKNGPGTPTSNEQVIGNLLSGGGDQEPPQPQ